jgi:hypothetical protein
VKTADRVEDTHLPKKLAAQTPIRAKKPPVTTLPVIVEKPVVPMPLPSAPVVQATDLGPVPMLIRADEPAPPAPLTSWDGKSGTVALKNTYIKYGATADYQTIVGRVHEWNKTLRLRYAPVEQPDAHGGSVMLEGAAELQQLSDGQHVRVRGTLIPATDRVSSARFRVEAVEVLD